MENQDQIQFDMQLAGTPFGLFIAPARIRLAAILSLKAMDTSHRTGILGLDDAAARAFARDVIEDVASEYGSHMIDYIEVRPDVALTDIEDSIIGFSRKLKGNSIKWLMAARGQMESNFPTQEAPVTLRAVMQAREVLSGVDKFSDLLSYIDRAHPICLIEFSEFIQAALSGRSGANFDIYKSVISKSSIMLRRDFVFRELDLNIRQPYASFCSDLAGVIGKSGSETMKDLADAGFDPKQLLDQKLARNMQRALGRMAKEGQIPLDQVLTRLSSRDVTDPLGARAIVAQEMAERLISEGYRVISRSGRTVARVDREDWREKMASELAPWDPDTEGMEQVALHESQNSAADLYRRTYSSDRKIVPPDVMALIKNSGHDPVGFVPLENDEVTREAQPDV